MMMPSTTLRTGLKHATPLIELVHSLLAELFSQAPLAAYDVVMVARDTKYSPGPFGLNNALVLIENGVMADAVREIVLASTDGDGLSMRLLPINEVVRGEVPK